MSPEALVYRNTVLNPFRFIPGMLMKLPSIIFWGIRVKELNEKDCVISLPFNWRTQNPFKSIYFAALAGAAEFSSGVLCQMYLSGRTPHAMLVVDFKAEFFKKADQEIFFSCGQGKELCQVLDHLTNAGDSSTFTMISSGKTKDGLEVARFYVTWSFKRKS